MSASFNQLLELVGRLDDQPGFDSPRERLRRYLTEEVTELHLARTLLDEGQHALGEQPHRALQDVIAILGRFLGFETAFGAYHRADGSARHHGLWRSRRRLTIVLDVFTDQTPRTDFDDLSKELASLRSDLLVEPDTPTLGLAVVTPMFAWRARLEQMIDGQIDADDRRVVSADCLVSLATLVTEGEVSHEEVVQLLTSSRQVDLVAGLLMRVRRTEPPVTSADQDAGAGEPREPAYWVATVGRGQAATFERMIDSIVGRRRVFGVAENPAAASGARVGDCICFFVPGKGIVGRAEVGGAAATARRLIRDSDRFSRLYQLKDVELFNAATLRDVDAEERIAKDYEAAGVSGPILVPVSRQAYDLLTARRSPADARVAGGGRRAPVDAIGAIGRGPRSLE